MRQIIDGGKDNALIRGDLSLCPLGNPYHEVRLKGQESSEAIATETLECVSAKG